MTKQPTKPIGPKPEPLPVPPKRKYIKPAIIMDLPAYARCVRCNRDVPSETIKGDRSGNAICLDCWGTKAMGDLPDETVSDLPAGSARDLLTGTGNHHESAGNLLFQAKQALEELWKTAHVGDGKIVCPRAFVKSVILARDCLDRIKQLGEPGEDGSSIPPPRGSKSSGSPTNPNLPPTDDRDFVSRARAARVSGRDSVGGNLSEVAQMYLIGGPDTVQLSPGTYIVKVGRDGRIETKPAKKKSEDRPVKTAPVFDHNGKHIGYQLTEPIRWKEKEADPLEEWAAEAVGLLMRAANWIRATPPIETARHQQKPFVKDLEDHAWCRPQ